MEGRDVVSKLASACDIGSGRSIGRHDLAFNDFQLLALDAVKEVGAFLALSEGVLPIGHERGNCVVFLNLLGAVRREVILLLLTSVADGAQSSRSLRRNMVHIVRPQVMVPEEFPYFSPTLEAPGCFGMSPALCLSKNFMELVIERDSVNLERGGEGARVLKIFVGFFVRVIIVTQIDNGGALNHLAVDRVVVLRESIFFILGHEQDTHHVGQGCPADPANLAAPLFDVLHSLGHATQIDRRRVSRLIVLRGSLEVTLRRQRPDFNEVHISQVDFS